MITAAVSAERDWIFAGVNPEEKELATEIKDYVFANVDPVMLEDSNGPMVQKAQKDYDMAFNYPGIASIAYGKKYDFLFSFFPRYVEPFTNYSGFSLETKLDVKQTCWAGGVFMDTFEDFVFADITIFELVPLYAHLSFPNLVSGAVNWAGGSCLRFHTSAKVMDVNLAMSSAMWGLWWSLTRWFAADAPMDDPSTLFGTRFFDGPQISMNMGSLWAGKWTWLDVCFA